MPAGGGRRGSGCGSSCRGRRGARWLPAAGAPRLRGTHQAANGCAEVYSRWRPTAPFLPPLLPPPSVLRSQSRRRVARRWNGWSPDRHHHLSCTREARGSAVARSCGCGSGEAGECCRAAPRAELGVPGAPGRAAGREVAAGAGLRPGRGLRSLLAGQPPLPFSLRSQELGSRASQSLRLGMHSGRVGHPGRARGPSSQLGGPGHPTRDLGNDLRRKDWRWDRHIQLALRVQREGIGFPSCAGCRRSDGGEFVGFGNRLTEDSLSVALTSKSACGFSGPSEDS